MTLPMYDNRKHKQGFTTVEMMVVIVIIGILTAIAVPNFLSYMPRMRLKSAVRDIISNMQLAKINAIKSRSTWALQFDTGVARYVVASIGADNTWNTSDDETHKTINLSDYEGISFGSNSGARPENPYNYDSDGITFTSGGGIANWVDFNSDGTTVVGTVYIKNGSDSFAIGVRSAAGSIKTWHNYDSGWEE